MKSWIPHHEPAISVIIISQHQRETTRNKISDEKSPSLQAIWQMEMPRLLSRASLWEVVVIFDMFLWANSWAAKKETKDWEKNKWWWVFLKFLPTFWLKFRIWEFYYITWPERMQRVTYATGDADWNRFWGNGGDVVGSLFLDAIQRVVPWIVAKERVFSPFFLGFACFQEINFKHMSHVF